MRARIGSSSSTGGRSTPAPPAISRTRSAIDPVRYGDLAHPGDAYSFDIFSQAGLLAAGAGVEDVLGGLVAERVIALGESQSAGFMTTYVNAVHPLAGVYDGVNVKLMKCGGIGEARRMIAAARAHRLAVMLGCMIESSVAITAAAHLAPLVDHADLDGHLLISNDPFVGARLDAGRVVAPDSPGLGVKERDASSCSGPSRR